MYRMTRAGRFPTSIKVERRPVVGRRMSRPRGSRKRLRANWRDTAQPSQSLPGAPSSGHPAAAESKGNERNTYDEGSFEDEAAVSAEGQHQADFPFPLGVVWAVVKTAGRRPLWAIRRMWNGAWRTGVQVSVVGIQHGPTTHSLGFTEPALRVMVSNTGKRAMRVTDVRLIFAEPFGMPVPPEAPAGRSHRSLPVRLSAAEELTWFFPAQAVSGTLDALFMPSRRMGHDVVPVYARCRFSSGVVCVSRVVRFPTDQNAHWPSPPAL